MCYFFLLSEIFFSETSEFPENEVFKSNWKDVFIQISWKLRLTISFSSFPCTVSYWLQGELCSLRNIATDKRYEMEVENLVCFKCLLYTYWV